VQLAILHLIGLLQYRVRPILPFEPVRRFACPQDVGGNLGIECIEIRIPAATAKAAARCQPETPPIPMKSGMT
jgi:hypothetical protein